MNKLISENHQDLGKIPIMDGGEKLLFGYKNIKNSFLCFALLCMHATSLMSNVSESESILNKVLLTREKLLHRPIIYHIPEHEKAIVVVAQAPKSDTSPSPKRTKKSYELKNTFFSAHKVSCFFPSLLI